MITLSAHENQIPCFVGYTRVSTEKQKRNLEKQAEKIRRWAADEGMRPISIHAEEPVSARNEATEGRRPALHEAFREARDRGLPLVVTSLSRLFRNVKEAERLLRLYRVPIISLDADGPVTDEYTLISIQKAQDAAINVAGGITTALADKRAAGAIQGSPGDNKAAAHASARVRADKAHALVQRIAKFLDEDPARQKLTDQQLVEDLNRMGIRTGWDRPWTLSAVRRPRRKAMEILRMEAEPDDDDFYEDNPDFGAFGGPSVRQAD